MPILSCSRRAERLRWRVLQRYRPGADIPKRQEAQHIGHRVLIVDSAAVVPQTTLELSLLNVMIPHERLYVPAWATSRLRVSERRAIRRRRPRTGSVIRMSAAGRRR